MNDVTTPHWFPVLNAGGVAILWRKVAPHAGQARKNHYQTLERLAVRGGLSWCELLAVLEDRPWKSMDDREAICGVMAIVQKP